MRAHAETTVLLWLFVGLASGCRLFHADWGRSNAADVSDPIVPVLRRELNNDRWTPNNSWDLLRDTKSQAQLRRHTDRLRSKFDHRLATEILQRLDNRSAKDRRVVRTKTSRHSLAVLELIARDDDLAGWNAAILLARQDPARAVPFAARLQELVASPVYYDPTTGRRTQTPTKGGRTTPPGVTQAGKSVPNAHHFDDYTLQQLLDVARDAQRPAPGQRDRSVWDRIVQTFHKGAGTPRRPVPGRAVSLAMRKAAAEAWCRVLAAGEGVPIETMAPAGRLLRRVTMPQSVRDELALGVAREISPGSIPGLTDAFTRNFTTVEEGRRIRRLAMRACVVHAIRLRTTPPASSSGHSRPKFATRWPAGIHDRATDPDPENRKLYGRWLALTQADDASAVLATQRGDIDDGVQIASIASLGLLETDDARRTLRDLADADNAAHRAAAVRGVSGWGVRELARFLRDPAVAVRVALAHELGGFPAGGSRSSKRSSLEAAVLMMRLVRDQRITVQSACLKSIKNWPDRAAVPVLIQAIRRGAPSTQIQAWQRLRRRIPHARRLPLKPEARSAAIERLISDGDLPTEIDGPSLAEIAGLRREEHKRYEQQIASEIGVLLRETPPSPKFGEAVHTLSRLDREALPIVEDAISRSQRAYPQRVYRALYDTVLPKLHPAWAALHDLDDRDPFVRRRAGTALAELGRKRSLSPLMVETLRRRIRDWNDGVLWSTALDAVMDDNHPEGDRLAIDAAHIEDPNVQMRALTYFARHPQSKFAGRILELMNGERSHAVRLAAIRAAGFCRHPSLEHGSAAEPPDGRGGQGIAARRGLKDWMLSPDQAIREAAALSLARFGSELGYQELYRRSFAPDPKQRVRAYRMMGETGQRRFVAHLIRRAGADGNTAARKAILNSLDELVPADEKPVGLSTATGYDNRIRVWSDWQKRRSNRKAPQPSQRPSTHPRATLPSGNHTSSGHSR